MLQEEDNSRQHLELQSSERERTSMKSSQVMKEDLKNYSAINFQEYSNKIVPGDELIPTQNIQLTKNQLLNNASSTTDLSEPWQDQEFSEDEQLEEKQASGVKNLLKNVSSIGSNMTGSVANFAGNINKKLQNLFEDQEDENEGKKLESSSDYKTQYLNQYGVSFTIPSLYVQASAWYPTDPSYFVQIVNYVVPSNDEYEVHTHYIETDKPKLVNRFEDIFQKRIQGVTVRLIKTQGDLSSIKMIDDFTFYDVPRVDHLDIKFSIDGKYFVIFSKENSFFRLYSCQDIEKIFDGIRNNEALYSAENVGQIQDISFGNNTKFLIAQYSTKMEIYHINTMCGQQSTYKPEVYTLAGETLECICDFYFCSEKDTDKWECHIAAKVYGLKKIKIIEVRDLKNRELIKAESNTINYFEDLSENFIIKIKVVDGDIKTVFVNGNEQFEVEMKKNGETNQMQLTQIGQRKIKFVYMDKYREKKSDCYVFACNDYDENLHVYKAGDINFKLLIKRDIQPNIIKVFDFIETDDGYLKSLSLKDDEFIIDQGFDTSAVDNRGGHEWLPPINDIDCVTHFQTNSTESSFVKKSYVYSSVRAFSINWPYVAFSGLENYILLINLFDRKLLHRVQFSPLDENVQVCQTFISNTKDLFVVVKNSTVFKILMLDLDQINTGEGEVDEAGFKFELLLEYPIQEVGSKSLTNIFARGSSRKEVIQLNQKLVIFVYHEDELFGWVQGSKSCEGKVLVPLNPKQDRKIISPSLQYRDDNNFYYCQKSWKVEDSISEIIKVTIGFSDFETETIIKENSVQYDYIGSQIDRVKDKLFIFLKQLDKDINSKLFLRIVDLEDIEDIYLDCEIVDPEMRGIFLSGQYKLVDGHIYFQNKVIKLRYELMKRYGGIGTNQDLYFNKYDDVLALEQGETIKIDSPLDSMQSHRFAYIMLNNECLACKRLMVIPYLHDRKVFLNRMKKNTYYFYTAKQKNISEDKANPKWISYIFAYNLNESKFYVYSEKGLLLNRKEFSDYTKQYGQVVSTSPDGCNFVLYNKMNDTIAILRFDEQKVCLLKSMNVLKAIKHFLKTSSVDDGDDILDYLGVESDTEDDLADLNKRIKEKTHWVLSENRRSLKYDIQLNNKADILIKISQKSEDSQSEFVYFFNANFKINKKEQVETNLDQQFINQCKKDLRNFKNSDDFSKLQGQNLMVLKKNKKFTISHDKIFLWDKHNIELYDFKQLFSKRNKKTLNIQIAKSEKFSEFENVSATDNSDTIAIVIKQLECSMVLSWSLSRDIENKAFEVDNSHEIIWDEQGEFLILSEDQTTLPIQNCKLKCFIQEDFENRNRTVLSEGLGYQQGYRFDYVNHNWVIMKHYIQMSFSYMTFVIQSSIEEIDIKADSQIDALLDKAFDLEAFTYMLNKNSCFTSGSLTENFLKLQQVLKKLLENDEVYLEVLHYTMIQKMEKEENDELIGNLLGNLKKEMVGDEKSQDLVKSAINEAFRQGNNRVVDIILSYMSHISINNSEIFKQVLYEVTDLQNFGKYLENLQKQSQQMKDKKLLKVAEPMNENIVAMATSHTAYVDDLFFEEKMGEDKTNPKYKVHPVEVLSLKIGWIINTPEGKEFLQAILMGERLDYYEIKSLQIIIEFLYQKSKALLLNYLLPLYLLQGVNFILSIIFQEIRYKAHLGHDYGIDEKILHKAADIIIILNQLQTVIMVCIMIRIFMKTGKSFFYRVYTWFDIVFYTLNTIASQYAFSENYDSQGMIRILQAFGILFFLAKNFYFMKLVDEIAPLIDIIIRIFIDIKWFMFIFFAFIVCYSFSFYLLGLNQVESDNLTQDDIDQIPYQTLPLSLVYMWTVCLGGGDMAVFELGDASQKRFLNILFISAQFTMLIHLLNMLIAIMGETFGARNEVAEQVKIKDHLAFVIDNWYLKKYALGKPENINYIITAFHVQDNEEDNEILENLTYKVEEIKDQITTVHTEITKRQFKQELSLKRQEQSNRLFENEIRRTIDEINMDSKKNKQMLQKLLTLMEEK